MKAKAIHKLDRDESSEAAYETEKIVCDQDDKYDDPKSSTRWTEVTCKKCLKKRERE